jgi:uncharacterized protein
MTVKFSMRAAFFLLLVTGTCLVAQTNIKLINSGEVIRKGIELHDNEKYEEAMEEFLKVERNDTNYALALIEYINTCISAGKDSLAVTAAEKGIVLNSEYQASFYLYKANALDNMKKYEESRKAYDDGWKRYPKNNMFVFESGTALMRQEKYDEAAKMFKKSAELNPYHPGTHLQLGVLALQQGKLVPAMMAFQFFLLLENKSPRAQKTVSMLESLVKGEVEDDGKNKSTVEGEDDFSDLETIIKSKAALSAKYKAKTDLEYAVVKQIQVFLEKLEYNKGDKGFYMQFYAPFYVELYKKDHMEPFLYNLLAGMQVEQVDKWVKKHESDLTRFANWATDYIGKNMAYREEEMNGAKVKVKHWYDNGKLFAEGNENEDKKLTGFVKFYYSSGQLLSEGAYDNKGEKTGPWKFYHHNGNLKEKVVFKEGKYDGERCEYYLSGALRSKLSYKNGALDGENNVYWPSGVIRGSYGYKTDKTEGAQIDFYNNGKKKSELNVASGAAIGKIVQYYKSGNVTEEAPLADGKRNGVTVEYHDLPGKIKKSEGPYKDGNPVGEWKFWHENGKIKEEGKFTDKGLRSGIWKVYDEDGTLAEEITYTEGGKLTGPYKVYYKGKEYATYDYKNGELMGCRFVKPDGSLAGESKRNGKTLEYTYYYPNGTKKKQGMLKSDKDEGEVKYFNVNGVLYLTEMYADGVQTGATKYYHENGKLKSELTYKEGELDGYYKRWYANGKLSTEGWYVNGNMQGTWREYNADGRKASETYYLNDDQYGWQSYFGPNGKVDQEEYFETGLNTCIVYYDSLGKVRDSVRLKWGSGDVITHFPNSNQIRLQSKRVDGMAQGKLVRYFFDGKVETECEYKDGKANGPYKHFWHNGKTRIECTYKDGEYDGVYKSYYQDGTLQHEWNYMNGEEEGVLKNYHANGKLAREAEYKKGEVNGLIKIYAQDGSLIVQRTYVDDQLVSYTYLDKTGKLMPEIKVIDETVNLVAYFQNGQKSLECSYKNGVLEGKWIKYHPTGKVAEEENFGCSREEGVQKYYYAGGQLKSEENYVYGEKSGLSKFYFENGKAEREEFYVDGNATGTWKIYNNTGKLVKTQSWYDGLLLEEKSAN